VIQTKHDPRKVQTGKTLRYLLCDISGRFEPKSEGEEWVGSTTQCPDRAVEGKPRAIAVRFGPMPLRERETLVELCIAKGLTSPNVLDYIPLTENYIICEIAPPSSFVGKSIAQLQLRGKHQIEVIAVRDVLKDQIQMLPRADFVIKGSEVLVVIGKEGDIDKVK
jgi:trk system potassium uptake protein TrkA